MNKVIFNTADSSAAKLASLKSYPLHTTVMPGIWLAIDSAMILGSGLVFYNLLINYSSDFELYMTAICSIWIFSLMLLHFSGLYQFDAITRPLLFMDKIVITVGTAFLLLLAAAFAIKVSATLSRTWLIVFWLSCSATVFLARVLASWTLRRLADLHLVSRNIVIVGGGDQCSSLVNYLIARRPRFLSVAGVFLEAPTDIKGYPFLGSIDDVIPYARRYRVDDIIIALPWAADEKLLGIITKLRELPINVYLASDLIGFRLHLRQPPSHLDELPVLEVMGKPLSGWDIVLKAFEDYILAVFGSLLLLPVFLLIAIAIKLDSRGPILFRQKRLGFNNRVFEIFKFRTMRHLPTTQEKTTQAKRGDPRVTRVGRFLRRFSLDELPQLLNVMNGTMSLVGPRPHAVDHNEEYAEKIRGYFARHRVKPGITGLAQIRGFRGETDNLEKMEARVSNDVYYAENWSLPLDLKILAMTLVVCIIGRNAY